MKKFLIIIGIVLSLVLFIKPDVEEAKGATEILEELVMQFDAVDATPLDGTTAGRTYMPTDRQSIYSLALDERCDAVEVTIYSNGSATSNDTALINIYGYGRNGPAVRIYDAVTCTLGTAVAPGSGLYADTILGTDKHITTVIIGDTADNAVCRVMYDTTGLRFLYFEPQTFTGITNIIISVRQYGFK